MIFLNIIKVIGIIILVIILLLILILAAILYLPIRYRIESRNMEVLGKASWIGLICIRFSYSRQKGPAAIGKALWIPFFEHPSSPDQTPTIKDSNKKGSNIKYSNNKESNEKESNEKMLLQNRVIQRKSVKRQAKLKKSKCRFKNGFMYFNPIEMHYANANRHCFISSK